MNNLLAAETITFLCSKDIFGRARFKPLRQLKKLPTPAHIRDFFIHGKREGVNAAQVIEVIRIACEVFSWLCPLVGKEDPNG